MTDDPDDAPDALAAVLPAEGDLPGRGWLAVDEGFSSLAGAAGGGEVLDCVGPTFPTDDEVVATGASPHFLRPPGRLLHGFALRAASVDAAGRAEAVLRSEGFATCLGRSVAADLEAGDGTAELLDVAVSPTARGHRVAFVGGTAAGVRPVVLDVVCVRVDDAVGLLWFADTPEPFAADDVDHVLAAMARRR